MSHSEKIRPLIEIWFSKSHLKSSKLQIQTNVPHSLYPKFLVFVLAIARRDSGDFLSASKNLFETDSTIC